jgi:hypothetical protein
VVKDISGRQCVREQVVLLLMHQTSYELFLTVDSSGLKHSGLLDKGHFASANPLTINDGLTSVGVSGIRLTHCG